MAAGVATGNYVVAAQGALQIISLKNLLIIIGVILFLLLLPIIVISSIPQMLFSWGTVDNAELLNRHEYGTYISDYYYTVLEEQEEGIEPDIDFLICLDAVRSNQQVESLSEEDVENTVALSFTKNEVTGEIYNKTQEEIMEDCELTDQQKNWVKLMYQTIASQ